MVWDKAAWRVVAWTSAAASDQPATAALWEGSGLESWAWRRQRKAEFSGVQHGSYPVMDDLHTIHQTARLVPPQHEAEECAVLWRSSAEGACPLVLHCLEDANSAHTVTDPWQGGRLTERVYTLSLCPCPYLPNALASPSAVCGKACPQEPPLWHQSLSSMVGEQDSSVLSQASGDQVLVC